MADNEAEGFECYQTGSAETREWFERQWRVWPKRADERYTMNIAFHYGAVRAYRAQHEREPEMAADFRMHVDLLDEIGSKERHRHV